MSSLYIFISTTLRFYWRTISSHFFKICIRFFLLSFQLPKIHRVAKQSKQKKLKQYKKFKNAKKIPETIWSSACYFYWILYQSIFNISISLNASFNQKFYQISFDFASTWFKFFRLILFLSELKLILIHVQKELFVKLLAIVFNNMLKWIYIVVDDKDIFIQFLNIQTCLCWEKK